MSHISGVKRPLSHSNSLTSEKVPKYGVDTSNEHELGKVIITCYLHSLDSSRIIQSSALVFIQRLVMRQYLSFITVKTREAISTAQY